MRILGFIIGFTLVLGITLTLLERHEVLISRLSLPEAQPDEQSPSAPLPPLTASDAPADHSDDSSQQGFEPATEGEGADTDRVSQPQSPLQAELPPLPDLDRLPPIPEPDEIAAAPPDNPATPPAGASGSEELQSSIPAQSTSPQSSADTEPLPEQSPATMNAAVERPGTNTMAGPSTAGLPGTEDTEDSLMTNVEWQPFWRPFNTRSSAQGFADVIADKTQLPIRVVETKPGVYRPAFPYTIDEDRQTVRQLIESQTGLSIDIR